MIYKVGRRAPAHHLDAGGGQQSRPRDGQGLLVADVQAQRSNLSIPTPRLDGDKLFVTSFYNGAMLLQLTAEDGKPSATVLWKGKGRGEQPQPDGHAAQHHQYAVHPGRLHLWRVQLRPIAVSEGGRRLARLGGPAGDRRRRSSRRSAGPTPSSRRRAIAGSSSTKRATSIIAHLTPKRLRGDRPRPSAGADQQGDGAVGRVVAPGLRGQVHLRPQRQGDRLLFAGGGMKASRRVRPGGLVPTALGIRAAITSGTCTASRRSPVPARCRCFG